MTKRFDEDALVERDAGMPSGFEWRGRRYRVVDVIGRWRIEGRWWEDGRDREYWRVEAKGGAVWMTCTTTANATVARGATLGLSGSALVRDLDVVPSRVEVDEHPREHERQERQRDDPDGDGSALRVQDQPGERAT